MTEKQEELKPDREKIASFCNFLENMAYPEVESDEFRYLIIHTKTVIENLVGNMRENLR